MQYTPEDDQLIRQLYPTASQEEILSSITGRSWRSIMERAHRLGVTRELSYIHVLHRKKTDDWTVEEEALLKTYYEEGNKQRLIELLPKRSWSAIKTRAQKKGFEFNKEVLEGKTYNHWKILEQDGAKVKCLCTACNIAIRTIDRYDVVKGRSKSCGCISRQLATQTNMQTIGAKSYLSTKEGQARFREVLTQKYGVDHNFKIKDLREKARIKAQNTMKLLYGVEFISQLPNNRTKLKQWCEENAHKLFRSQPELEILSFVQAYYPSAHKIKQDGHELDIFIPELNLGLEHNGLYRHSELFKSKRYHLHKTNYFQSKGVRIIHIWGHEWQTKQAQVKSFLLSVLNKNQHKIGARKCKVIWSNSKEEISKSHELLDTTHIQGFTASTKYVANVYHNEELVATATFGKHHRNSKDWVLTRFVTKTNHTIQGILSKISSLASRHLESDIISWADYRLSDGNGYEAAGWHRERLHPPDYFYWSSSNRIVSKQSRQRKKVNTPLNMTEHEHALQDKLLRIYDCGKIRYVYKFIRS